MNLWLKIIRLLNAIVLNRHCCKDVTGTEIELHSMCSQEEERYGYEGVTERE